MSQIQSFGNGGGMVPVTVVETLTGDVGGAVAAAANNINVLSNNQQTEFGIGQFNGTIAANTLSFEPLVRDVITNDGVFTTIASRLLSADSAIVLRGHIIGARDDFTAYAAGFITGGARKEGVNPATAVGAGGLLESDYVGIDPTPAARIITAGDTIQIQVRGIPAETWTWKVQILYQFVS